MSTFQRIKLEALDRQRTALIEEFESLVEEVTSALSRQQEIKLERKISQIGAKIELIEDKINTLRILSESYNEVGYSSLPIQNSFSNESNFKSNISDLDQAFRSTDYKKALNLFSHIYEKNLSNPYGGTAIILLQNGTDMGVEWYLQEVEHRFFGNSRVQRCPVDVKVRDVDYNEILLLKGIAGYFNINEDNIDILIEKIIEKMCDIDNNTVIIINIDAIELLGRSMNRIITAIIDKFWSRLTRTLRRSRKGLIRFILCFISRATIPENSISRSIRCSPEQYDYRKIAEIPLSKWTKDDIKTCIFAYKPRISSTDVDTISELIDKDCDGIPDKIYRRIQKYID